MSKTRLHICYVHGWQGDHTSFQSFPTALHSYLETRLHNIELFTHIYPTYKAARPILEATAKLLRWIETLPDGLIILAGHSLGGFLTADASLEHSRTLSRKKRVIGMIAFDVPYLGIHPHVIISGLASVMPGGDDIKEADMNDMNKVSMVDAQESSTSLVPTSPRKQPSALKKALGFFSKHGDHPIDYVRSYISEFLEFGSCVVDKEGLSRRYTALNNWTSSKGGGDWIQFFTVTVPDEDRNTPGSSGTPYVYQPQNRGESYAPATVGGVEVEVSPYGEDHAVEAASTGSGLDFEQFKATARKEKAKRNEQANKKAEQAVQKQHEHEVQTEQHARSLSIPSTINRGDSGLSILSIASRASSDTSLLSGTENAAPPELDIDKEKNKKNKKRTPHHFIVLPWKMDYRWQSIAIEGVDDEVNAHTGIFFPSKNYAYESLVERTATFIIGISRKYI